MEKSDIRWKQRFQNFERTLLLLKNAAEKNTLSDPEKAGLIQIYEVTFELAWKMVKDYLEEKEVVVKFPKDTIKEGFAYELINDGDLWLDMLQKRNLMSQTYNETNAALAHKLIITEYYQELMLVYKKFKEMQ